MKGQIERFSLEPKAEDLVLLRHRNKVIAVGKIPISDDQYKWNNVFEDVLGWDLQHTRRVIWDTNCLQVYSQIKSVFSSSRQRPTFTRIHNQIITNIANNLSKHIKDRPLKPLPDNAFRKLSSEEIGMQLFTSGLPNQAVDNVLKTIFRIQRMGKWNASDQSGNRPSENEIVTHMITPLLIGMGWSEQLVAIEWDNIDLAFFNKTPTTKENCIMICEAKRQNQSLTDAFNQAKDYVSKKNLKICNRILTTDGQRLFFYKRVNGSWDDEPSGYVNLMDIREKNIFPMDTSGIGTLMELIPWVAMRI